MGLRVQLSLRESSTSESPLSCDWFVKLPDLLVVSGVMRDQENLLAFLDEWMAAWLTARRWSHSWPWWRARHLRGNTWQLTWQFNKNEHRDIYKQIMPHYQINLVNNMHLRISSTGVRKCRQSIVNILTSVTCSLLWWSVNMCFDCEAGFVHSW